MPVMIVGADTPTGDRIAQRLFDPEREVRVFVTDLDSAKAWRQRGAKAAQGDVSDDTHVGAACLNCFSVILISEAAIDQRERSFASTPTEVLESWARAVESAGVERVIWVSAESPPPIEGPQVVTVDPSAPELAERIFELDEADQI